MKTTHTTHEMHSINKSFALENNFYDKQQRADISQKASRKKDMDGYDKPHLTQTTEISNSTHN